MKGAFERNPFLSVVRRADLADYEVGWTLPLQARKGEGISSIGNLRIYYIYHYNQAITQQYVHSYFSKVTRVLRHILL